MTTKQINRAVVHHLAKQQLARLLSGEHPENDTTPWDRRVVVGLNVFRDAIREAVQLMDLNRITVEDAVQVIDICKSGIDAFMRLDEK
jgi:DNA-binding FadR family transcriptional regulator